MTELSEWNSFYTMTGAAAATLTGLMFVQVTLLAQRPRPGASETFNAFNSPSVVHFAAVLGFAALLIAPWPFLWQPEVLLGLAGVAALSYMRIVIRRARRQTAYTPVLEDQIWHILLPCSAYGAVTVASLVWVVSVAPALFLVGAAAMLLLFIGIHNAWDNVTYVVLTTMTQEAERKDG